MVTRLLENKVRELFSTFRIVYITGARQVGKTTLIKYFAKEFNARYLTFDDPRIRESALASPEFFLETAGSPVFIDEIQKVPEIIDFIKVKVDTSNSPGQILMTGSSNIFHNPKIYESLSGRIAVAKLYPFSSFEVKIDNIIL